MKWACTNLMEAGYNLELFRKHARKKEGRLFSPLKSHEQSDFQMQEQQTNIFPFPSFVSSFRWWIFDIDVFRPKNRCCLSLAMVALQEMSKEMWTLYFVWFSRKMLAFYVTSSNSNISIDTAFDLRFLPPPRRIVCIGFWCDRGKG